MDFSPTNFWFLLPPQILTGFLATLARNKNFICHSFCILNSISRVMSFEKGKPKKCKIHASYLNLVLSHASRINTSLTSQNAYTGQVHQANQILIFVRLHLY